LAPGIRLLLNRFSLSFTSENFVDINFSSNSNDSNNKKKVFLGAMAYNFPIQLIGIKEETYLRPMFYLKSIPQMETQLGLNALLSSQKFWVQGGYNNFYGASAGVGGIFFESLSIGVLMEFGLDQGVKEMDPTFELITAIRFGNKKETELLPQEIIISQELKDEQEKVTIKNDDKVIEVQKQETTPKAKLDSIKTVKAEKEEIVKAKPPLESKTITKGKYEEVEQLKGLQPGYYLIANVYGTKKYFDNFMETLRKKGIEPKSFYRSLNKFNYVYLDSYSSLNAAEKARDSKFYGRYADATWIFRVISE
jgi:hypothetical protein